MCIPTNACAEFEDSNTIETFSQASRDYFSTTSKSSFNEYENFKSLEAKKNTNISERNNAYINSLRILTSYSREELEALNYSEGNIQIIEKLKKDPSYIPSDAELLSAAATLDFWFACSDTYMRDTKTYFDYIWWYEWSSTPMFKNVDAIAFHWLGDFYMDEYSAQAEITYSGNGNSVSENFHTEMKNGILPNKNACCFEVPVSYGNDKTSGLYALEGSGSFTVRCNDHGHPDMSIEWAYGEGMIGVQSVDIEVGNSLPSITLGKYYEIVVSGKRTYYVN